MSVSLADLALLKKAAQTLIGNKLQSLQYSKHDPAIDIAPEYDQQAQAEEIKQEKDLAFWLSQHKSIFEIIENIYNDEDYKKKFGKRMPLKEGVIGAVNAGLIAAIKNQVMKLANEQQDAENKKEKNKDTLLNWISFIGKSSAISLFQVFAGMSAISSFLQYVCGVIPFIPFYSPAILGVSIFFGLISAAIGLVFDVKAVADNMGLSYLTASKKLNRLSKEINHLIELHHSLAKALNQVGMPTETQIWSDKEIQEWEKQHETLISLMETTRFIQDRTAAEILEFEAAFKATKQKRMLVKIAWLIPSILIYGCTAHLAALAFIPLIPALGFPPLTIGLTLIFLITWIAVEVYRFWSLERREMNYGVDTLFGARTKTLNHTLGIRTTANKLLSDNEEKLQKNALLLSFAKKHQQDQAEKTKLLLQNSIVIIISDIKAIGAENCLLAQSINPNQAKTKTLHFTFESTDINNLQQSIEELTAQQIKLENQLKELKIENDQLKEKVKTLESQVATQTIKVSSSNLFTRRTQDDTCIEYQSLTLAHA